MNDWKHVPREQTGSTFSELIRELNRLSEDTRAITELTRSRIEDQWFLGHADIFPLLAQWKERLGVGVFSTFDVARAVLYFKPLLSDAASVQFADEPMAQAKSMDAAFGAGTAHMLCLTIASQDLHCDFKNESIAFPIVLFERTCGLVLARVPGLTVERYETITTETTLALDSIRRSVFQRHLPEAPWLARAS